MADRKYRYGMILLEETPPTVLQVRGVPMLFTTLEETVQYAQLHGVQRWMVTGREDGWWPVYTQTGPENPLPEPKVRVDISLHHT